MARRSTCRDPLEVSAGAAGIAATLACSEGPGLSTALLTYVRNNPGQRSEEITAAFSTDAASLRTTTKKLTEAGQVRTEGEQRGTRYFAADKRTSATTAG